MTRAADTARLGVAAGLLAAAVVVYAYASNLERSPVYLHHDEIVFSSHGYAIASTGRDLNGRVLPLFFHVRAGYWATPVTIYWMALFDKILPLSEATARLPTVVVGLINVLLVYLLGRRLFERKWLAAVAALVLATTPAHYLHSRLGVDHLYPLPFVLVWLLCLHRALDRYEPRVVFAGTLALGIGFYSYLAAVILMPLYFLVTCVALYARYRFNVSWYLPALAGFVLPVGLIVPWLLAHPEHYTGVMQMYGMYDTATLDTLAGAREIASAKSLARRFDVYYAFYSVSALFFSGGSSLLNATRETGVFLVPLVVLLPVGAYRMVRSRRTAFNWILLAVFFSAAIPGAVVSDVAINRGLVVLPCAALMATYGLEQWLLARQRHVRLAAACLLAILPLQFAYFYRDYHGGYRARSSYWFEGNIRGGIEEILARAQRSPDRPIFLTTDIDWVDWYWRFYVHKHERGDLLERPSYVDPRTIDLSRIPPNSLVLARTSSASPTVFDRAASRFNVMRLPEPAGAEPLLAVFERKP